MKLRLPLALAAALLAACSFMSQSISAAGVSDSISINFGAPGKEVPANAEGSAGAISILGSNWNNAMDANGSLESLKNGSGVVTGVNVAWSSANNWAANSTAPGYSSNMMSGYLDDGGAGNTVTVSGISFLMYDVYIYANTDSNGGKFNARTVNGIQYTFADGVTKAGTTTWGDTNVRDKIAEGSNYLKVSSVGDTLVVKGAGSGSTRGCTAGIQIVNTYTGVVTDYTLATDALWNSLVTNSGEGQAQAFNVTNASGVTLNLGGQVVTDGIMVKSGSLTLTGGTVKFTGPGILNAGTGATVRVDVDFSGKSPTFTGAGNFVFTKNVTWEGSLVSNANFIFDGGGFTFNNTEAATFGGAVISGNGSVNKTGTGVLNLSGGLSYATGDFNLKEGSLNVAGSNTVRNWNLSGGTTVSFSNLGTIVGGIAASGPATFNVATGQGIINGAFAGNANYVKTGAGYLTLLNEAPCFYTGTLTVQEGFLTIGNRNDISKYDFGKGTIVMGENTTVQMVGKKADWNQTYNYGSYDVYGKFVMKNGSTMDIQRNGNVNLRNVWTIGEKAGDQVTLYSSDWNQSVFAYGGMTGAGDLYVKKSGSRRTGLYLFGDNSTYTGTIKVEGGLFLNDVTLGGGVELMGLAGQSADYPFGILLRGNASTIQKISTSGDVSNTTNIIGNALTSLTIVNGGKFDGKLSGAFTLNVGGAFSLTGDSTGYAGRLNYSGSELMLGQEKSLGDASLYLSGNATLKGTSAAYRKVFVNGGTSYVVKDLAEGGLSLRTGQVWTIQSNAAGDAVTLTGNLEMGGGSLVFNTGTNGALSALKIVDGKTTKVGSTGVSVSLGDEFVKNGSILLLDMGTGSTLKASDFSLSGFSATLMRGQTNSGLKVENEKLYLVLAGGAAANLSWKGGDGTWAGNAATSPWTGAADTKFYAGDNVTFGTLSGVPSSTVTISGNVDPGSITVNADATTAYIFTGEGAIIGSTSLVKSGKGKLTWNMTGNSTFRGGIDIQDGLLVWKSGALGSGKVNVAKDATLQLWEDGARAANGATFTANMTGTGTISAWGIGNITDSGGGNADMTNVNLGAEFKGTFEIKSGLFSIVNSQFGSGTTILLNGGGLATNAERTSFNNNIQVGDAGGIIRLWGSQATTYMGTISGTGDLKHTDGGVLTLMGDMSGFSGAFNNAAGTVNIYGNSNFKSYTAGGAGNNIYGNYTITGGLFAGANMRITGSGTIGARFSVQTATIDIYSDVSMDNLRLADGYGAVSVFNIRSGNVVVRGALNTGYKENSVLLALWGLNNANGTLNLMGGSFTADQAKVWLSADGPGTMNISGGTASALGFVFRSTSKSTINLTGGRLNVGSAGMVVEGGAWNDTNTIVNLGAGILGATADWSTTAPVTLTNSVIGLVVNTEQAQVGHSITLGGALGGVGKLIKEGAGTLKLTGANTFTGGTILRAGTLALENESALGAEGNRGLTIDSTGDVVLSGVANVGVKADNISLKSGNLLLDSISLTVVKGMTAGTGTLSMKDSTLTFAGSEGILNIGLLKNMTGSNTIDYGASKLIVGLAESGALGQVNLKGTGAVKISGKNAMALNGLSGYVYAGTGGVTLTGSNSGAAIGLYGGSWDAQTDASGKIVVGSKTAAVTTAINFGETNTLTAGIYGAGAHLGTAMTEGVNAAVLSDITLQGVLSGGASAAGTTSNTNVTGQVYGGGKSGANVYGSTKLSLDGVNFTGGKANKPEDLNLGSPVLAGGGFTNTTVYGNVTLNIAGSIVESNIYGTAGSATGNVTLGISDSKIKGNIIGSTYGPANSVGGTVTLTMKNSALEGNIYGARDGVVNGKVTLNVSGSTVTGDIVAGGSAGTSNLKKGADIVLDGVTAGLVGIAGSRGGTVIGDSSITIKGDSHIANIMGSGGEHSGDMTHTLGYGKLTGNLTVNIQGGEIGAGLTGVNDNDLFAMAARNGVLTGDAILNVTGGTIKNPTLVMAAAAGTLTGNATLKLSGTGKIESNIYSTSSWGSKVGGDFNVILDGGVLGVAGQTRKLEGGTNYNFAGGGTLAGGMTITLDGTLSQGVGTQILGDYSILAGASDGPNVGGNTKVTLKNISKTGGIADFGGTISGTNKAGTGVNGSSRELVFDAYKAVTGAQYTHFTLATVKGASAVVLSDGATLNDITGWDIQDTSTLTLSKNTQISGLQSSFTLAAGAGLVINAGEDVNLGPNILKGQGTLTKNGAGKLIMSGDSDTFAGKVNVTAGSLTLTGTGNSFGASSMITLKGGALVLEKTGDMELKAKISGNGALTVNNAAGKKTTLSNTGIVTDGTDAYTGKLNVNSGILELAAGVNLKRSDATIADNATLRIMGKLSDSAGRISNVTESKGTLYLGSDNTLNGGSQVMNYTGRLAIGGGAALTVSVTGGTQLVNSKATLVFSGSSVLKLNNASGATQGFTLGNMSLTGVDNQVKFEGSATNLTITNGDEWMGTTAAAGMGQLSFDITEVGNSTITITNLTNKNHVFANIFLVKNGITYQTQTDSSGRLIEITLDQMTELPKAGVPDFGITTYKITDANGDLAGGELSMQGAANISSVNIVSSASNTTWNLNGHDVTLMGGSMMYQGTSDYTIKGGNIYSQSGIMGISQMSAGSTLTLSANIMEKDGSHTAVKKMGAGTMVMEGTLGNTGGLQVVGGKLILKGKATGSATSGTLSNNAELVLGDGSSSYVLGYAETENNGGTLTVTNNAELTGKVTNNATLVLKEGSKLGAGLVLQNNQDLNLEIGVGKTLSVASAGGNGTMHVKSGTLSIQAGMQQNFDISENAKTVWNLGSAVATGRTISGAGSLEIKNVSNQALDMSDISLGTKWDGFTGALTLSGGTGTMKVKISTALGADKLIVNKGTQFWDNLAGGTRTWDLELNGMGVGEYGTLRISNVATYAGDIKIGTDGAWITSDASPITLTGNISGGKLKLGMEGKETQYRLSGTNSHELTTLVGRAKVSAESTAALGGGLDLSQSGTSAGISGKVETGLLKGVSGSSLTLEEGSQLKITGTTDALFAGDIYGDGDLVKSGSGTWTLSGNNSQNGTISVEGGMLKLGSETGLGANGVQVKVSGGAKFDLGGYAAVQGVTLKGSSELLGAGAYNGILSISGNGEEISKVTGDLRTGQFVTTDGLAKLNVGGNLTITGGGRLFVDSNMANAETAAVTVGGNIKMDGKFDLYIDTNGIYQGKSVKFKLFEAAAYPGNNSNYTFQLAMDPAYNEYFQLKDNYKQEMVQTGSLTVTINVKAVVGLLKDSQDVAAMGDEGYKSPGEGFYLGAKDNGGEIVYFDKSYSSYPGDNAYRLTNGDGWLAFATEMGGDNKLVLNKYLAGSHPDSGVILVNNHNSYTGGTSSLNVKLIVDGSLNETQAMEDGGRIGALGTGAVTMLGREAILELRPNGAEGNGNYSLTNDINLRDGAQLIQSGGNITMTGNITVMGNEAGIISNQTSNTLTLAGGLTAEKLTLKGRRIGENGLIEITGGQGGTPATIGQLTLNDNAQVKTGGRDLTAGSLAMENGSRLITGSGSHVTVGALAAGSQGTLVIEGGLLSLQSDATLGSADGIRLSLGSGMANTLDTGAGSTITLSGLGAEDGNLTKAGAGTLALSGDYGAYKGAINATGGLVKVDAANLSSNLAADGDGTKLQTADKTTLGGSLTLTNGAEAVLGADNILNGNLTLNGGTLETGKNTQVNSGEIQIGSGAHVTFGEGSLIGMDGSRISLGSGSSVTFGKGSALSGQLNGGLTLVKGSTYQGELDAGNNQVTFAAGSTFIVDGSTYQNYTDGKTLLSGTGTINLEKGMEIRLDKFAETMTPLPVNVGLISTSGSLQLDGQEIEAGKNYNNYLADNPYVWLAFDLVGSQGRLDLNVKKDVRFGLFADTKNEQAISGIASDIALHSDQYQGELGKLGESLSKATYSNVNAMLGDLALSTSSVLSGYAVQMQNLRRHTFELLNRASQLKPENTKLSYEETNNTLWANGIGGTYKINGDANALGNTTNVWGGTIGMSTTLSDTTVAGLAFTYTDSEIRIDRGMGKSTLDAYNLDLFAKYHKDNWNITGIVTGGFTSNDSERNLTLDGYNGRAKGSADGAQIMAMVQAGYEIVVSQDENSILEPFILVAGGYSKIDGFSETGAGTAGLNVSGDSTGICTIGAGVRFVREYMANGDTLQRGRFEARAMVLQDATDMKPTVSANFLGAPGQRFVQEGAAPGKTALILGAGVMHPVGERTSVFADVDGEFRNGGTGVGANLGIKYMF